MTIEDRQQQLLSSLTQLLGPDGCLSDAAAHQVYARDASHLTLGEPLAVVLPETPAQVAAVVCFCYEHKVPFVGRGAGTCLSGGAVPADGMLVISLARLTGHWAVDEAGQRIRVEAGVVNEHVSRLAHPAQLLFAPDPGSQSVSTIGGNIAENAGGPHTLKVGVTRHHLLQLEWIDSTGHPWTTGRGLICERGIDLICLLTGSEGTLGLVTAADLKLMPSPPAVATLLAIFPELDAATMAVVTLLGDGLLPAAMEMVDRPMLVAVEEAFHFGFPTDVAAAMIVEFDGPPAAVAEDAERAKELLRASGAREIRQASDDAERTELWRCRKKAFGAVGRLAPNYVSMDVVVPLGRLPDLIRSIGSIAAEHGVRIGTGFHAGDGNVHPGVHYDERDPESTERAYRAADAIIRQALAMQGSISGEHGIGLEKKHLISEQLDVQAGRLSLGIKQLLDPHRLVNPGKLLPEEKVRLQEPPPLPTEVVFRWDSLVVTAPAEAMLADIQAEALARGYWIPTGAVLGPEEGPGLGAAGRVEDVINQLTSGPSLLGLGLVRDYLLEIWAETGDNHLYHAGAPVFKNVAGYDLVGLLCGADGILARPKAATFQLRPVPEKAALWHFRAELQSIQHRSLSNLLYELQSWPLDLAAPICVIDAFEVGPHGVTVLVGGRDRSWDLSRKEQILMDWARQSGLELAARERCSFTELPQLARHPALPKWARRSPDWTFLTRRADHAGWPGFLSAERVIWQGAPRLLWAPLARCDAGFGWHADTLYRGGDVTALPAPDVDVPTQYLIGLKDLFDPQGWLGEPDWLEQAREGTP